MKWFLNVWMDLYALFALWLLGRTNYYLMPMVVISILKAVDASLSVNWNTGLIPRPFNSVVNSVKAHIIYLSLLFFIYVFSMALKPYKYTMIMYLFPLLYVIGKRSHRYEKNLPSFVVLEYTVVQNTTFILLLYLRSVSGGFSLVDFRPCFIICRCPIVVFIDFQYDSWWASLWGLAKSSWNLVWLPWGGLLLFVWKVLHGYTVPVLVWLSGTECYLPQLMIIVSPGELHIFQISCFLCLLLFVVHCFGLTFLACLVWWCIYNHIRLPMILVSLFLLGKCKSD